MKAAHKLANIYISAVPVLLFLLHGCCAISKKYNLNQLDIIPSIGKPPMFGLTCRAAAQLVFDTVNNRSDILPDYFIRMQLEDERLGIAVVSIVTSFFDTAKYSTTVKSPITVGPFNSGGCKAMGPILHHINAIALSTACGAATLTNRALYPNLYLSGDVADIYGRVMVHFIEDIGHWRRIAIITYALNLVDYTSALITHALALQRSISVPIFNGIADVNEEDVLAIKKADIRIVVLFLSMPDLTQRFLCFAHRLGMRGGRYVFMGQSGAFMPDNTVPDTVPSGCSKHAILEQYENIYWFGSLQGSNNLEQRNDLGHNGVEFDAIMMKLLNNTMMPDFEYRYQCYDAAFATVFALDSADKELRSKFNLTLADYRQNASLVANCANKSMANIDRVGLRTGRISYSKVNGRMENDIPVARYWTRETGLLVKVFELLMKNRTGNMAYVDYYLRQTVGSLNWPNGKPPKDRGDYMQTNDKISGGLSIAITVLAGLLFVCQLTAMLTTFHFRTDKSVMGAFPLTKCLGYFASFAVDGAAICFAAHETPLLLSHFRIVLLTLGLAGMHSVVSFRCIVLWLKMKKGMPILSSTVAIRLTVVTRGTSTPRDATVPVGPRATTHRISTSVPGTTGNLVTSQISAEMKAEFRKILSISDRYALFGAVTFASCFALYLVGWLIGDPLKCSTLPLYPTPFYYEATDTFVEILSTSCQSAGNNQTTWVGTIIAVNGVCLLLGLYGAYSFRKETRDHRAIVNMEIPEMALSAVAAVNALALLVATILIFFILGGGPPSRQYIVIALASLTTSSTTSLTWFYPLGRKRLGPE